jgi:streptomycin 6-kinase
MATTDMDLEIGSPFEPGGRSAWVAPARSDAGDVVLTVTWRHPEAEHEAEGLDVLAGDGAVRLHASQRVDDSNALLIERCAPGTARDTWPEPAQDDVIAALLPRLWREPAPNHPFRPL